ncbi:MAG TPA: 3-hydroxyacyl-CoA dehydrogenase [Paracoccus sp. (in: a-proteobacteria)]|uniref:3-hydroxyacyl-CoA dehydrogenase n=1 Tax=Paracoccus sp. TaxID=267 RepID=UPI002BD77836|nr:3-hydroxyacyl-CoA dehydrogenase [Paracoccus sp. (in: a-proteobacteria)]HWL55568.1 3-hydroxyacyl-CoA dehydrogenase [Paracoccus sp. (in: a-proteobacteria)]
MTKIAIVGAGLIGRSWAMVFARAGLTVRVWDADPNVLARLGDDIASMIRDAGGDSAIAGRITACATLAEALEGADWVQENGPENAEIKRALFAEMDRLAAPGTILASSSSALMPSVWSDGLAGAARCLVAHPVNPPHLVPIVELCPSPQTSPEVMDRASALFRSVGQVPARLSREIEGFVLNRLQAVLLAESLSLVEQGVIDVQGLDDTIRHGLGRRWAFMGPMETILLNAPGGVPDYIRRYGPMLAQLTDSAARGEAFTESAGQIVADAFPQSDIRARQDWRDRELAALDRHLRSRCERND